MKFEDIRKIQDSRRRTLRKDKRTLTEDDLKIVLAHFNGEISLSSINKGLEVENTSAASAYIYMALVMKWAYQNGKIKIA